MYRLKACIKSHSTSLPDKRGRIISVKKEDVVRKNRGSVAERRYSFFFWPLFLCFLLLVLTPFEVRDPADPARLRA